MARTVRGAPASDVRAQVELTYQSPVDDAALTYREWDDNLVLWRLGQIEVAMPPVNPFWSREQMAWYLARRDANLMGVCPLCEAVMPATIAGTPLMLGRMLHEDECPLIDGRWVMEMFSWHG